MKTAMTTIETLEKDCTGWKAKAEKYKDIAARGHRVAEKRASVCFPPTNDALIQTQQQLEQEKMLNHKLNDNIHQLQDQIRKLIATHQQDLTAAESHWNNEFSKKEVEYHLTLDNLEEKIIRQKEMKIKVFSVFSPVLLNNLYLLYLLHFVCFRNWRAVYRNS